MRDDSVLPFRAPLVEAELLERFLAGECTPGESARVRAWAGETQSGVSIAEAVRDALRETAQVVDPEEYRQALQKRLRVDGTGREQQQVLEGRRTSWAKKYRLPVGGFLYPWLRTAGVLVGVVLVILLTRRSSSVDIGVTTTYVTEIGQRATVSLPDGTRVTLAPQTTLRLVQFGTRSRVVTLDGEAYFDVTRAHGTPFIVHTGAIATRVLGTTFFVRHYRNERGVRVAVTSGKVNVTTQISRRLNLTLTTGEVSEVRDSLATVRTVDDLRPETGWLKDELIFTHTPVPDVLATLSRWYGYEFRCVDSTLIRENITVGLSTRSSAKAFATLQQILDVQLTISGDTVTLSPQRSHVGPQGQRDRRYNVWIPSREVGR